jgi:hypothetical protein
VDGAILITMAIRSKNNPAGQAVHEAPAEDTPGYVNNPAVDQKIDAHIAARPRDFDYYTNLVKDNPDRAVRLLIWKDQKKHESDMKVVLKQLPGAREFYDKQAPEIKLRIDEKLKGVNPYFQDKAFVGEVLREMDRQNRQALAAPRAGVGVAAG